MSPNNERAKAIIDDCITMVGTAHSNDAHPALVMVAVHSMLKSKYGISEEGAREIMRSVSETMLVILSKPGDVDEAAQ